MTPQTQRRLYLVGALVVAGGALAFISFGNVGENLVYYWDPSQLVAVAGLDEASLEGGVQRLEPCPQRVQLAKVRRE